MMTPEKIQELKITYLDHIKDYLNETGGLFPHITIIAEHRDPAKSEENAIIHVPIPDKYMGGDDAKQKFVDNVVPGLAKKLNEDFIPQAVVWASEAWVRSMHKDAKMEDYKDLPIEKEVLIIVYESNYDKEIQVHEMIRNGKQVNKDGNLVDAITLVHDKGFTSNDYPTGRFTGLLKKFQLVN